MRFVAIGNSVFAGDINDPEVWQEGVAGGIVIQVDVQPGPDGVNVEVYRCARNRHGKIVFSDVREDQVVTHEEHFDRATASNVYRALAREVGTSKRANSADVRKLQHALMMCEMWAASA